MSGFDHPLPVRIGRWVKGRVPEIIFLLVTTAAGVWAAGRWIDPVSDPGFSWSLTYRLAHGERLYRDVYFAYGPLSPYLLVLGARLFGYSTVSLALANWIPAIVAGLLLIRCGRRYLSPLEGVSLVGVLLAISLFVPGAGRLVFPYYAGVVHALALSVAALFLLQGMTDRLGARAYLAGLLAGLAFCCKQEIGVAALIALVTPVLLGCKKPFVWLAGLIAGFLSVLTLAALFVLSSAPIESLRWRNHLWPLNASPPAAFQRLYRSVAGFSYPDWALAIRSAAWRLLFQIALCLILGLLVARERSGRRWLPVLCLSIGLAVWWAVEGFSLGNPPSPVCLSMVVAFLVAILALLHPRLEGRIFLVAFGTFAGLAGIRTAFSTITSGSYDGPARFAASLTWVLFLCVLVPNLLASAGRARAYSRNIMAVALLLISWTGAIGGMEALRYPWKQAVQTRQGPIFVTKAEARLFEALSRTLIPGDKALVLPEINAVDVLFGVRSVSPFLHLLPGLLEPTVEKDLIARFEKDPPDVVVIFDRPTSEYGVAPFGKGYGLLLAEWCFRNYRVAESFSAGMILRRSLKDGTVAVPAPPPGYNRAP